MDFPYFILAILITKVHSLALRTLLFRFFPTILAPMTRANDIIHHIVSFARNTINKISHLIMSYDYFVRWREIFNHRWLDICDDWTNSSMISIFPLLVLACLFAKINLLATSAFFIRFLFTTLTQSFRITDRDENGKC